MKHMICSLLLVLVCTESSQAVTLDGVISSGEYDQTFTIMGTVNTPAEYFAAYGKVTNDWVYVAYEIKPYMTSGGQNMTGTLGVALGLKNPLKPDRLTSAGEDVQWSFALEDWFDFETDAQAKAKWNDGIETAVPGNVPPKHTRDIFRNDPVFGSLPIQTARGGDFSNGETSVIEFAFSKELLEDAFGRTYLGDTTFSETTDITIAGHYKSHYN